MNSPIRGMLGKGNYAGPDGPGLYRNRTSLVLKTDGPDACYVHN